MIDFHLLLAAYQTARRDLLALRVPAGHWVGELSSSPFATAAAASALCVAARHMKDDARRDAFQQLAVRAVEWLVAAQSGGGWGDIRSGPANPAATMLARAAIHLAGQSPRFADALATSLRYLDNRGGVAGLRKQRGHDRAIVAAVLGTSAIAGMTDWRDVPALAFELAWLPRRMRRPPGAERGHVEPIRVGMGHARYFHRWPRNPLALLVRRLSVGRSLASLARTQPPSGGLLESAAWTAFALLGLASTGRGERPLARRALSFLVDTVRGDASWPLVADRSVANTALAIDALAAASGDVGALGCVDWLLNCQRSEADIQLRTPSGSWAASAGAGSFPNVDDTAAVLLALSVLLKSGGGSHRSRIEAAARAGVDWLLGLQNADGGWPTYYRGAARPSLDGSAPELTARALRALRTWQDAVANRPIGDAIRRGMAFLASTQQADGSWPSRWFGSPNSPGAASPIYATAQAVLAHRDLDRIEIPAAQRALEWLAAEIDKRGRELSGGAAGGDGLPNFFSIEETALVVEALLAAPENSRDRPALEAGLEWLVRAVEEGRHHQPAPIGLLPPRLWYSERVCPVAYTISALGRAVKLLSKPT